MVERNNSLDELGDLQRAVMELLWQLKEAKVADIRQQLNKKRDKELAYTTVLSVIQKLEKAGWVTHHSEGRTHVYSPTQTRETASGGSIRRVLNSVFAGDPMQMFQQLINEESISESDLSSLRKMIDQRRKELKDE